MILKWLKPVCEEILQFACQQIPCQIQVDSLDHLLLIMDVVEKVNKIGLYEEFFCSNIFQLSKLCQKMLIADVDSQREHENQLQRYAAVKCLALISKCSDTNPALKFARNHLMNFIRDEMIQNYLNKQLKKFSTGSEQCLQQNQWGRLASDFVCCVWQCLYSYLVDNPESFPTHELAHMALDALNISADITGILCKCLTPLLPQLMDQDVMLAVKVMNCLWKAIFERRKSDVFWTSLKEFVEMVFQPKILSHPQTCLIYEYINEVFSLSENSPAIFHIFFSHFCKVWGNGSKYGMKEHLGLIKTALTFGSVHRKDQRIQFDAACYINSMNEKLLPSVMFERHCTDDMKMRAMATALLLTLSVDNGDDELIANDMLLMLLEEDKRVNQNRCRYFGNSFVHRVKNRIWQNILLLEHFCSKEVRGFLLNIAYEELMKEGSQPSVRVLQEWLTVRILMKNSELRETLWTAMKKAPSVRIASIASFLAILAHLGRILNDFEQEEFMSKAMAQIVLWCMTHNFTVRVTAQASFLLLWKVAKDNDMKNILANYQVFGECLSSSFHYGNTSKAANKLVHDFYFNCFHCDEHYTIETIFKELPRLTGLSEDETILPSLIHECFSKHELAESFIPFTNLDDKLTQCEEDTWFTGASGFLPTPAASVENSNVNYQKKLTPWKQLLMDECSVSLHKAEMKKKNEGLVVVASIIDRIPNLGGLCRTCEIFGASEFVISNMKFVEDKQFQNLSVSSEQWVTIKQVDHQQLKEYLPAMRHKGYTLIGIEQTACSTKLHEYKFPKKTLLLLGNEKEGIPVELIQLLDVCIEIPQQGIVRSLNVHVSGAVTIWEYARQHLF